MTNASTIAAPAPLLLDAAGAAALCGVSRATWFGWQAAGQIPVAVLRRGRVVRWSYAEIVAWIAAGCPARDRWRAVGGRRP
jgi:predicted DNA-binding transcriptional regulator AlpA